MELGGLQARVPLGQLSHRPPRLHTHTHVAPPALLTNPCPATPTSTAPSPSSSPPSPAVPPATPPPTTTVRKRTREANARDAVGDVGRRVEGAQGALQVGQLDKGYAEDDHDGGRPEHQGGHEAQHGGAVGQKLLAVDLGVGVRGGLLWVGSKRAGRAYCAALCCGALQKIERRGSGGGS